MRSHAIEDAAPQCFRRGSTSRQHTTFASCSGRGRKGSAQSGSAGNDADAELALRAFRRHVWLVCRCAPAHIFGFGESASDLYARALCSADDSSRERAWRDFVRAVWLLVSELDRQPSQASNRWRDARGALSRIVVDNIDLLERRALGAQSDAVPAL